MKAQQLRPSPLDLSSGIRGRHALVTGGARGIGRACVEALLAHGARVSFTYKNSRGLAEELAGHWRDSASCHFLDLGDTGSLERCLDEAEARWGPLHILVNNAAVGSATIESYEPDPSRHDEAFFHINALGALRVARAGIARMRGDDRQARKLINVSTVGALQTFAPMRIADNMSKATIVHMSQQLAAQLTHDNIDVFAICPGATDTEMFQRSTLTRLNEEEKRSLLARLPRGRLIQSEELASLVVFLSSSFSSVLHGAVLDCSLGLGVHPGLITGGHH